MADGTTQTVAKRTTWWRELTALERRLALLATVTLLAAAALTISLGTLVARWQHLHGMAAQTKGGVQLPESQTSVHGEQQVCVTPGCIHAGGAQLPESQTSVHGEQQVCVTPGCIHAASLVLSKLDPRVDPCDDFYQYACGNYVRTTNIPDDKTSVSTFSALNDLLLEKLRNAIEEEDPQAAAPRSLQLARHLYRACMNKSQIESRGVAPLQRVLREQLGGWPVLEGDSWDEEGFHWLRSVYRFRSAGYSDDYFLKVSVETDYRNSTRRAIHLDLTSLGLGREILLKGLSDRRVQAYYQYQVDLAVLLGADRARAERELRKSLKFEIALARISVPERWDLYSVGRLQREYPSVPWLEYLQALLPSRVTITNDEVVVLKVPTYLKMLLTQLTHTPKRLVANYAVWRAAEASVRYLTEELRERQLLYQYARTGSREWQPRSRECVQVVATGLPLSAGSIYVRRHFDEDAKRAALEMVDDIRREFFRTLQEVDWMDDATRKKAIEKAQSMVSHIAYPDELLDDSKLDRFYEKLTVSPAMYLESVLNVTRFLTQQASSRLRRPVNKTDWTTHGETTTINAYYDINENSILFPAGILQGAFFSADRPKYMNYGGIGSTIGHEITHGFDDKGRKYDKDGNLVDWWDPVTRDKFLNKAHCIVSQYGNFTDKQTGMNLNGANTQGENIADNGGIKEAYVAYLSVERRAGRPEPRLPGLSHLSPRHMFWVSIAQTWCSKHRTEQMLQDIATGVHSPSRFRILGPFSNRPEFAKDFGCPVGSPMNPVLKCQVW